jgi:hypothetical protein
MNESPEQTLKRYLTALVATLVRRQKNAGELCHLLGVDAREARTIWRNHQ